ncbi:MAG: hypothetical protein JWR38_2417 [Mucilaginibacter sp.]|nr:hypothetical protein [Mucilaginibacter sp.]
MVRVLTFTFNFYYAETKAFKQIQRDFPGIDMDNCFCFTFLVQAHGSQ